MLGIINVTLTNDVEDFLYYDQPPLLQTHINKHACCEICMTDTKIAHMTPVADILHDTDKILLDVNVNIHTPYGKYSTNSTTFLSTTSKEKLWPYHLRP